MKNYIQNGDTITLTTPHNVTSGSGLLIGAIFGVACNDALAGTEVEAKLTGVFQLAKVATEAWTVGSLIYWDDAKKLATSVPAPGANLIGVAIASSANPSTAGVVRLSGMFLPMVATTERHGRRPSGSESQGMFSGLFANSSPPAAEDDATSNTDNA